MVSTDSQQPVQAVYLSPLMDFAGYRWKFYMQKHDRNDIFERTRYLPADFDINDAPPGSLLVFTMGDPAIDTVLKMGRSTIVTTILNAAGSNAAVVLKVAG